MAGRARVVLVLVLVLGAVALGAGGCVFKGGGADAYRCGPGGTCAAGLECVDGVCVTATQSDGGGDAAEPDGPGDQDGPGPDGPGQADAQQDAARQQDAAPGCVFDPLSSDQGTFTPVLASSTWQFGSGSYNETYADDLHVSWIDGAGGDHVSMQASVRPVAQGRPLFDSPNGNFASAAGVIVRASGLSSSSVTGYFCGVDLRGQRLLLGRMSGAYSPSNGTFTILGSQSLTVAISNSYLVQADAQGGALTCTSGTTQVSANDSAIATGSVGLFTLGARASFTDAMYCLP
jgi:hypothetical protein